MAKWSRLGIGSRLKRIRTERGLTQAQLAAQLGCTQAFVSDIEIGRSMPGGMVTNEVVRMGFSREWFLTGIGDLENPLNVYVSDGPSDPYGATPVPLVGRVCAGAGKHIPPDEVERMVPVFLGEHQGHECFVSRVTGHSMEPVFFPGDMIVVDKTCPVANNDVAVVAIDDQVVLKRVTQDGDSVYLLSINQVVPPIRVSRHHDGARIVGKVIQLIRSKF